MTVDKSKKRMLVTVAIILIAAVSGLLVIGNDGAAQTAAATPTFGTDSSSAFVPLIKMFSALVVVLIAIYVGVYLLRRTMGKKFSGNRVNNALQVIETTYVAPKKSISLVRVADRSVLIGVTEQNISMLTELDAATTAAFVEEESESAATPAFADFFKSAAQKVQNMTGRPDKKLVQAES